MDTMHGLKSFPLAAKASLNYVPLSILFSFTIAALGIFAGARSTFVGGTLLVLPFIATIVALMFRPRLTIGGDSIVIRNLLRTHFVKRTCIRGLTWHEFRLGKGDRCPALVTKDKTALPVLALYGRDLDEELKTLLSRSDSG